MSQETAQHVALVIIWCAAPALTLSWLIYSTAPRWYRSWTGWALWSSMLWAALLVDLALAFRAWDGHAQFKLYAALGVYGLIAVGAYLMLAVVVRNRFRRH